MTKDGESVSKSVDLVEESLDDGDNPAGSVEELEQESGSDELVFDKTVPPEFSQDFETAKQAESSGAEQGIAAWGEVWKAVPGHPVIVDSLKDLYAQTGKWHPLVDLFKKQSNAIPDESRKIYTLMSLAGIYDDYLKQDVMVVNTFQSILKVKPDYLPAMDAAIVKYKSMGRWPDLVKMLKAKGGVVEDAGQKVTIFLEVAELFRERFSNQAEAIKAYEKVLEADPSHDQAITFLKEMYEKRRDWEKLIRVMSREVELLPEGPDRASAAIEIAQLATERLKRPAICVELWEAVLEHDPENESALQHLAGFYERTKEWEKLTAALQKQLVSITDTAEQIKMLQKLGQVYGDKLSDDARAVESWKALLEIQPDDRRAQEQLKKRYLAMQAWDELTEFYSSTGKWDEFIRVLEREADKPNLDVQVKISLNFKIAELWRDQKSRPDRAARCYENILELDPLNLDAAQVLIPILEEGKDPAKLADVLEVQLDHLTDTDEKLALRQRIARIAEDDIGDADRAFEGFLAAFKMLPNDETTQEDLERSAGKAGAWETAVEAYKEALEETDLSEQFELQLRLARVLYEELGQPEEALGHYDTILAEDPRNPRAVASLEKIYAQMGRYEELLDIYSRRLDMAENDDERKEVLYNQALLWEEEVGDTAKSVETYNQIIEIVGDEPRALSALDRLYTAQESWSELADVIQRELEQTLSDQEAELELRYRLGQVSDQHLNNKAVALDCYRDILAVQPDYEAAQTGLEGLLGDEETQAEAAQILAPVYEERGDWEKLVETMEILVKGSADPFDQLESLLKIGQIYSDHVNSPERAFVAYSRAFKLNPVDERALEMLEQSAVILDSWKEMVELLEEGAASITDVDASVDLWMRAARVYDTQIDDIDRAINAFNSAFRAQPHNMEVITALEQIYSRTERWSDLIEILQNKVEMTDDFTEKEQIYRQMAMIYGEMLEKPEDAVTCLKEILNFDAGNAEALSELDRMFGELGSWTDLADNLQQQLSFVADPQTSINLKLRLGELRETQLDETGAAIENYREVLDVEPQNEQAIAALERILEKPKNRRDVAEILEPIYRNLGDWEKLVHIFGVMIAEEEDLERKVDLLHQIATLYETAGDNPEEAFNTIGRALTEDPSDERTLSELERLARVLDHYEQLAKLYESIVESVESPELEASFHLKIALVYEEQLHNMEQAIEHYRQVLTIDPMHLDAASALERAYTSTDNYEQLALIYLRKVEIVSSLEEQKELLFKASQIYEEILDKSEKAIGVYLRVLSLDEDDINAIAHLEELYLMQERWSELQDIYNRKVDLVQTPEEKKEVLYVLGAMYEREIADIQKAIDTYQRIIEFDPDDFQAIQRLDMLYTETEEWHDLLSILEREVVLAADDDEAISFKFRIGELFVRHLDDISRAMEYFREILTITPHHEPSIQILEELLAEGKEPMLVAEVLEPLYQELANWRQLIAVLEVKLKNIDDNWQRVELIHQIAQMLESELHLDAPNEAFDAYARALKEDNANEKTLSRLEDLAAATGRWEDLATLLDEQLQDVVEVDRAVGLGLRAAAIYEEKLDQTEEAIERFQKVLEFDGENRAAITRLDRLFQVAERWEDLAAVLAKEAFVVDDPAQSLEIQFRLGQIYQLEINDMDRAVETYRDILAAEPTHETSIAALEMLFAEGIKRAEIVEILEPLFRMHAEWAKLVSFQEAQLEELEDNADRVAMMHRIAEIYEEKLLDSVESFNWYCRIFSADAFDERAGEECERLARATGAWNDLADLYQDLYERNEEESVKRLCAKKLARVARDELADAVRAEQAYRACLELGGDDVDVLEALDSIYTEYMEWERDVAILEKLAEATGDDEQRVAYVFRLGNVYETQLGELEKARQCYHRVADDLEPDHWEAMERLEVIYADQEAWSELYEIYSRMSRSTDSESTQADLYAKMAVLSSECLDNTTEAIELWKNILDIRGEDMVALDALAELYSREENWSELVDMLERAVTIAEDDESRIRLYSQLGLVWGECLSRDRSALENWENVLSIDPENVDALKAIIAIHEANQDWGPLIETLERIIEVGMSQFETEELKGFYAKLGRIFSDTLEQPIESIDAWQKAFEVDPTDIASLIALEKLYDEQEMLTELVEVLGQKAELLDGDDQVETLLRQAEVLEEKLDAPDRAKGPYLRILEGSPLHERAFERIVEIETKEETWEELTQIYFNRLNYVTELKDRVDLYYRAAKIYEDELGQPENAFIVMQRAFEEDYSSDQTADYLERLASVTDKWNELLQSSSQVLQNVQDKDVQINLCLKIGKWYANELGHPDYAIAYYQQVLQLDAENVAALKLIGELYRGSKQWVDLVEVLKRAVAAEEDPELRKQILVDLGQIHEEYLQDVPAARKSYKDALDIDPSLETALVALERLFGQAQNWRELIPVLERKIEVLEDAEAIISTHMRIGEIYEEKLDDALAAVDEYRQAIEIDQGHILALKGLERLYGKLERWQDLMDVLQIQLEYAASERERIELLTRLATMLEEEFVKPEQAAESYEQILEIDSAHEGALEALERIYRQGRRWQDLIATFERHIEAAQEAPAQVDLYRQMGQIYATELDDVERAIESYNEILLIAPETEEALDELAELQIRQNDWSQAHDILLRLAEVITDPERKVDLYYRLGMLNEQNLLNREVAVEHFRSALDLDPSHLPSLQALHQIHLDNAEWVAAARIIEAEQESTENARAKSRLQYELGELHSSKLDDDNTAIQWYEAALESDSDNEQAAEPLVKVYVDAGNWDDAATLLDMLIRLGTKRPPEEMAPFHRSLGLVADKLNDLEKALKAYQSAYEIDSSHLPTLIALADIQFRNEDWNQAFRFYQMVLVHHRDKQSTEEIVEIFYRLGYIKAQLSERRKALNMFDKALEIEPLHQPTIKEIIKLHDEQKNYEQVIHYKKILMDAVDEEERFNLLVEIGDLWQNKLKNAQKAITSYSEAAELRPDNRPLLHKLLPLYQATKQWQKVVDIIKQVASMEEDSIKLGRLYYSTGVIYRDEIKSAQDSVEFFNMSLDASLENLKAFEAIDRILTQRKDWKSLERNYRRMLHRIAGQGRNDLEINLWHFLGEIYRTRMGQFEAAAEAFKMASNLDPDNVMRHEILAELFQAMPESMDRAVAEHQWLIKQNPYRVDSYKALRKLYFDNRQYDKAWCLCATLAFLKKANREEQQFFEQYRTRGMVRAQARLDNEKWIKSLFHTDESIFVGKIFELITRAVRAVKKQPIKSFGLRKGQRRPANDTMTFSKTFFYAAQVLNLPAIPELYIQEDKPGGLNFAITDPMISACGAALLSGFSPQDLLFIIGKHLSYYRPEHYIRWVLPTHSELKLLLLAAVKIGAPDFQLPEDRSGTLRQYVQVLRQNLSPIEVENLGTVVKRFIKAGEVVDIKKWIRAVELTACRSGLLLANDLEVAARMIQAESGAVDDISPKEKIKELVLFSVSEDYFMLRESLGIIIGT